MRKPVRLGSKAWRDFEQHVQTSLVPKMKDSAMVMILAPPMGEMDIEFAVQIGAAILLEKPLLVLAIEGRPIPPKLERIADRIIYAEHANDPSISDQIKRFMTDFGKQ